MKELASSEVVSDHPLGEGWTAAPGWENVLLGRCGMGKLLREPLEDLAAGLGSEPAPMGAGPCRSAIRYRRLWFVRSVPWRLDPVQLLPAGVAADAAEEEVALEKLMVLRRSVPACWVNPLLLLIVDPIRPGTEAVE